jgi:hypothetical protein
MKTFDTIISKMGTFDTIKIYSINTLAFLSTLSNIDAVLKTALLMVSIAYTIFKIVAIIKNDLLNKNKNENNS